MICYFTLKLLEPFNNSDFVFHQVNILNIYSNHLWSKNITIFTACLSTHWTAHIKMCYFQQVATLFHLTETTLFSHLAHVVWFAYLKWFKIKWVQTIHLHGVSSCVHTNRHGSHVSNFSKNEWVQRSINMALLHAFYTNMTQMAVPQVGGTIITILYLLAWTCVSLWSGFQWTIHFRCKTIEGIIQINRVTIILLKWITVLR